MKKLELDIDSILSKAQLGISRWELDNIKWSDRASNPKTLFDFLSRIQELESLEKLTDLETQELEILVDLSNDLDEEECVNLLSNDDEVVQQNFIESLARQSALEVLTNGRVGFDTMTITCKLSPTDFILTAKRTQDLISAIQELVIQGETLSNDVAGA
jgi:hypothetical protein